MTAPPLHPSRPSGTECAAIQADAGFVVSCIDQGRPMTLEQATARADRRRAMGRLSGAFRGDAGAG